MPFNVSPNIVIDGEYQLRSQAICGGGKYPGTSAVVGGLIDREGPLVFGSPTPIDGILSPDDVISVTFNEDVQCGDISIGAGDIALYNSVLGIPVDFAFSCGGNMITFDPIPANIYLENQVFRAEVHNLSDMYGNLREESITWEFFVNKNPIEWNGTNIDNIVIGVEDEYMTQRELVNTGGSNRSYTIIGGREGAVASGAPLNLPIWISVSPLEGTLTPGASQNIDIGLIDIVAVNLYPFKETVAKPDVTLADAIENIDIGGPSMVRSAAKNYKDVAVLTNPEQYGRFMEALKDDTVKDLRPQLALEAFQHTAEYDAAISKWMEDNIYDNV